MWGEVVSWVSGTGCRSHHCHYLVDQDGSWFQMSPNGGNFQGLFRTRSQSPYLKKELEA
jgi:hypothetical protein